MPKRPREDDPNSRVVLTKALRSSIEQKDAPSIIRALNRFSETQHRSANVKEFTMAINACLSFGDADSVHHAQRVSEMMQQRFSDPKEWGEQGYSSLIRLTCAVGGEEGLENAMNMLRGMQAAKLLKKRSVGPILRLCLELLTQREGAPEETSVPSLCVEAFERAQTANLELGVEEFANLFGACALLKPARNLFLMRVFQTLQDQMPVVPAELREQIQRCMEAAGRGIEGATVETCEASGEGVCQGVPLEKLPILECERDGLLEEIVKLVPEGQRAEFGKFTAWVAEQGGFDAVVDGANLGYSGMSKWGAEARDRRAEWRKTPKKSAKKSPLTASAFNVVKGLVFKACSMAVQALESLTKFALPRHYYTDPLLEGGSVPPPPSSKPSPPPEVVAMMSEQGGQQTETAKMEKRRVTVGTPLRLDFLEKAVDALREKEVEGSEIGSVFVVLNARHLQLERVEEQYHPVIERLKQKCHLWTSPRGVNDDLFWMYAGIYSLLRKGAWVLTNDQMRDHKFRMLYPRCFPRWYDQNFLKYTLSGVHQLNIGIDDISLFLHPPRPYATCPQMYGIGEETIKKMQAKLPEAGIQQGVAEELEEVGEDWPSLWRIPFAREKGASTQWICAKFS